MNFNFFEWIRNGVKQSVLMGVTDAVQTMGAPQDDKTAKDKIMGFLQSDLNKNEENNVKRRIPSPTSSVSTTKKLGRSITDINTAIE
ncbi:MAG: hypothetical protein LBE18_04765 [Planctomycetaceae bacterium]|jgi:hypothetical protein|nr:hypothetical protein [Planctomycetaceae bacterium]